MAANTDPQRRPVLYDLRNQRLLADPVIGNKYHLVTITAPVTSLIDGGDFDSGTSVVT